MRSVLALFALCVALVASSSAAPLDSSSFSASPLPVHFAFGASSSREGVRMRALSFSSPTGHTVTGLLVYGNGRGRHAPILWVHWLGEPATTNHTEFMNDAIALAKRGATSLLLDAPWAKPHWFSQLRTTDTDYTDSVAEIVDLRRALDVLLAQPNVDASKLAYVGHDFGSMYGAVLSGVDPRPQWYVLMAGTTTFSEWFLLGKKPADVAAYVAKMEPLDPLPYLTRGRARGYLFQFSAHDEYVTREKELQFFEAAPLPRAMYLYDVDHSLATPLATHDRLAWLADRLELGGAR